VSGPMPTTVPAGADHRGRAAGDLWTNRPVGQAVEDWRLPVTVDYSGRAALRG